MARRDKRDDEQDPDGTKPNRAGTSTGEATGPAPATKARARSKAKATGADAAPKGKTKTRGKTPSGSTAKTAAAPEPAAAAAPAKRGRSKDKAPPATTPTKTTKPKRNTRNGNGDHDRDADGDDDRGATRERLRQVAYALQHRDEIVSNVLALLYQTGLIDSTTERRLWAVYESGDTRTRMAMQDLVSRVLRVPLDRVDEVLGEDGFDPERINVESLDRLRSLRVPKMDVDAVSESVRGIDVERLAHGSERVGSALQFVADVPVALFKLRRNLLIGGVAVLLLVAAALAFPAVGLQVAFYGFLAILALLGAYLLKLAYTLDRTAKRYDLDLAVFARLDPEERRIIMLRRLLLRFIDMDQVGDLVDRGLRRVVPEGLREDERPVAARPQPRRPLDGTDDPTGDDRAATRRGRPGPASATRRDPGTASR